MIDIVYKLNCPQYLVSGIMKAMFQKVCGMIKEKVEDYVRFHMAYVDYRNATMTDIINMLTHAMRLVDGAYGKTFSVRINPVLTTGKNPSRSCTIQGTNTWDRFNLLDDSCYNSITFEITPSVVTERWARDPSSRTDVYTPYTTTSARRLADDNGIAKNLIMLAPESTEVFEFDTGLKPSNATTGIAGILKHINYNNDKIYTDCCLYEPSVHETIVPDLKREVNSYEY